MGIFLAAFMLGVFNGILMWTREKAHEAQQEFWRQ